MHLKHVILDGFKSYRDRTDIGPFDPHFNAITGLNGSGKSNILDAIAFVLGLSSMSVVRAANLGDLIYKGGASGVSRASASLIFDNRDRARSPVGYEKHDEIIISRVIETNGTCKFFLNSITSTKKLITEMFESVQLNISNANFMIMQGKITKVINMTPKQILGMIEETVGGNVYQGKRDKTEQEIKNKDRCMELVKNTIHGEIYPEWTRQRNAREKLEEFHAVQAQTSRALKYYAIMQFKDLTDKLKYSKDELDRVTESEQSDDAKIDGYKGDIDGNKKRQAQMKKENVEKFKDKIENAEKVLTTEKKKFVTIEAKLKTAKLDVDDGKKKKVEAEKAKKQQEKEMQDYKKKSSTTVDEFETVKAQIANAQEELNKAKEQENALKMGNIVDEEGKAYDARQELMRVQDEIHKIDPDYQVASREYDHEMRQLETMQKELRKTPSNDQVEKDYNEKFQRAERMKADALRRNINPDDSPSEIIKSLNEQKQRLQQLGHQKENMFGRYDLAYRYQRKDEVNPAKINGCLYELLKFNNLEEYGGALEVLAGGVFSHLVVEDEFTGKALLRAGLNKRLTIHPLSVFKTTNRKNVTQQELDRHLGPGKAIPAISLIECEPRFQPIVQHFFGGRVLCDTTGTARKIANELGHYAVSKIGDVADPDGLMQGGTRRNLGQFIITCDKLRKISQEIKQLERSIEDLELRLRAAQSNADFMKQLDNAKRDLQHAEATRQLTTFSILQRDIEELKQKLQKDSESLKERKTQLVQLEKDKKSWTTKVNQLDQLREKGKKENAALITKWEKALEAAKKKYDAKEKHFGNIDVEIKSREALIQDCQQDIDKAIEEINQYNTVVEKIAQEFDTAQKLFEEVQARYDEAVAESQEWNAEYNQIEEEIRNLNNAIHKIEMAKIKRGNAIEKLSGNVHHCESEIDKLKKEHKVLNFDKEEVPPEDRKSLHEMRSEAEKLKKSFDSLKERIDVQAAEQFQQTKSLLRSAEDKVGIIESNKKDLLATIGKLDDHKLNIVMEAYTNINEEFNKMMGTLLPDSAARLVPVNIEDLSQGLNIHVQLGGIWKESLSELSGGQKSLVALALVLSLCMYNPAPLYILDEIDSALDLNHTQNIGVLIRKRFTDTQFVCVSLKDGMYSNCNILFQVTFNNGKSEVKRCVRQSSKKTADDDHQVVSSKNAKRFNKIVSGK